jgi:hypothetical protein
MKGRLRKKKAASSGTMSPRFGRMSELSPFCCKLAGLVQHLLRTQDGRAPWAADLVVSPELYVLSSE